MKTSILIVSVFAATLFLTSCDKCIECTTSVGAIKSDPTEYCGKTLDVEEDRADYMEECEREKEENPNLNIECECHNSPD